MKITYEPALLFLALSFTSNISLATGVANPLSTVDLLIAFGFLVVFCAIVVLFPALLYKKYKKKYIFILSPLLAGIIVFVVLGFMGLGFNY